MENEFIVHATDVHKTYHTGTVAVQALRGVSLSVKRKEVIAVMGPSGCGKTTLLNCLSGLDAADQGEISIEGNALTEMSDHERTDLRARRMGFVFQFYNLLPVLSAVENVEMPLLLTRELSNKLEKNKEVELIGTDCISWLGIPLKTSTGETFGVLGRTKVRLSRSLYYSRYSRPDRRCT